MRRQKSCCAAFVDLHAAITDLPETSLRRDHLGGHAHSNPTRGDVACHEAICGNRRIIGNGKESRYYGSRTYPNPIADRGNI